MDADRFDALTRSLTAAGSRRRALATALSGALGLLGLAGPDEAAAAKSGKCKPPCGECATCKRGDCKKKQGRKKRCKRGKCQPLREGTPCTNGTCQSGSCIAAVLPCPQGLTVCSGSCVDTRTAQANCGGCGIVCGPRQTCCGGDCVSLNTNRRNCGACGNVCPVGTNCCNRTCSCVAPQICCRGTCQTGPCV